MASAQNSESMENRMRLRALVGVRSKELSKSRKHRRRATVHKIIQGLMTVLLNDSGRGGALCGL